MHSEEAGGYLTCKDDACDDGGELAGEGQGQHAPHRPRQPQLGKLPHELHRAHTCPSHLPHPMSQSTPTGVTSMSSPNQVWLPDAHSQCQH